MSARKAVAEDFGLTFRDRMTFDPKTMDVTGCHCASCWRWKTTHDFRHFWIMKGRAQ